MGKYRAFVHMSDGEPLAVYLLPEDLATPELGEEVEILSAKYQQPIHDVIPYHCETRSEMLDCIDEQNPTCDED